MSRLRHEFETLQQNGIARIGMSRIGDPSVIPLWFGEGDLPTPEFIREAAKSALDDGQTFYNHPAGRPDLRAAIKAYLDRLYEIDLDVDRITVPGSTMLGISMAARMALGAGDHALIVSPNWPNIDRAFQMTGAAFDFVRQRIEPQGWRLELDDLFAAARPETKALFLNTPCNPTGWVMPRSEQQRLLDFCRQRGIVIIADEVYHRNVFEADVAPSFLSIAEPDDPLIVVNGFSKAFAMTGWRLGWMVAPAGYGEQMAAFSECSNTGAPPFVQSAGIVALTQGESFVRELRERYRAGREAVMQILALHPRIELSEPAGAFYAFPHVRGLRSSLEFVHGLLAEKNVGLAPGFAFGPGNEAHFRLCFAQSHERLETALGRIRDYLDDYDFD
jgi:aspartate/methionine/tyrosine aminotransferase